MLGTKTFLHCPTNGGAILILPSMLGRVYTTFALFSGLLWFFVANLDKIHNALVAKVLIFKTD